MACRHRLVRPRVARRHRLLWLDGAVLLWMLQWGGDKTVWCRQLSVVVVVLLLDRPKNDVGRPRQILMDLTGIAPNAPYFNSSGYVHGS